MHKLTHLLLAAACALQVVCRASAEEGNARFRVGIVGGSLDAGEFVSIPSQATDGWEFQDFMFNGTDDVGVRERLMSGLSDDLDMVVFTPVMPGIFSKDNDAEAEVWKSFLNRGGVFAVTSAQSRNDQFDMMNTWFNKYLDQSYQLPTAPVSPEKITVVTDCYGKPHHPFRDFPSPQIDGMTVWGGFLNNYWARGLLMGNKWEWIDNWEGWYTSGTASVISHYGKGTIFCTCFRKPYFVFFENLRAFGELYRTGLSLVSGAGGAMTNSLEAVDFTIRLADGGTLAAEEYVANVTATGEDGDVCETNIVGTASSQGVRYCFNFLNTVRGKGRLRLCLRRTSDGAMVTLIDRKHVFEDVIVPILPTYRGRVSTERRSKDIRLGFRVNPAGERFGGQAWTATVTDESGSEWARLTGTLAEGEMTVPLEMPVSRKAPAGDYALTVSVDDANGGSVTRSRTFKIVAPKATQILVDQDGRLLRNGKPYFPMGVYGSNDDDSARVKAVGFNLQHAMVWGWGEGGESDPFRKMRALGEPLILELAVQNKYLDNMRNWAAGMSGLECAGMNYTADEPMDDNIPHWEECYRAMAAAAPDQPVCYANRYAASSRYQSGIADIMFSDPYAGYATDMQRLDIMRRELGDARAVFSVFHVNECLDADELRRLVFGAIVHGANGLMWYQWGNLKGTELESTHFPKVIAEVRAIEPQLLSTHRVRLSLANGAVQALECGERMTGRCVICVNETDSEAVVNEGIDEFTDGKPVTLPARGVAVLTRAGGEADAWEIGRDDPAAVKAWIGEDGTLVISGKGATADFGPEGAPWCELSETLTVSVLGDVTEFGANAFAGVDEVFFPTIPPAGLAKCGAGAIRYSDALDPQQVVLAQLGIRNMTPYASGQGGEDKKETVVSLTVSNVVVQYVFNSVQPGSVVPQTTDPGFVNVITEVKGGSAIAIPSTWAERFPKFQERFGQDFARALTQPSGKVGAYGPMQVWQDFVAGTDPTDPDDRFVASITVAGGKPVVSWTPELKPEDAARRIYTTYGKAKLSDAEWTVVDGDAEKYNFFRVTVEMLP